MSRSHKLLLALVVALPLVGIADAPATLPPASDATCCNLASAYTSSLFPGGDGDEGFFGLAIGAPSNAMILLDTSSSMLDFPVRLPTPDEGTGGCGDPTLNAVVPSDTPFDNGTANTFVVDAPPWGLASCNAANSCLFDPASHYKYVQDLPGYTNGYTAKEWHGGGATEYTAAQACTGVAGTTCAACLASEGYYLFRPAGDVRTHARFSGAFLNAHPPKFVIARKVLKDLVAIDPAFVDDVASTRFGLTVFTTGADSGRARGLRTNDGGKLVVPLGPNCTMSAGGYEGTNVAVTAAYQQVRQKIVDAVNSPTLVSYASSPVTYTPLAESLFNIGQYFSDTRGTAGWPNNGATGPVYDYMFNLPGTSWTRSTFYETAAGTANAPWVSTGRQASVCWACQQSSVVVITDGEPTNDENLPRFELATSHQTGPTPGTASENNDFPYWNHPRLAIPDCPGCSGFSLHKVADFLYKNDLRPDLPNTKQTQTVATYTVSFGIAEDDTGNESAHALLDATADLGGGEFYATSSADELRNALYDAIGDTVARATSFSVSNTNTLQTGNTNQLFLARFRRLLASTWEGHLHRFRVFNEFVQGCESKRTTSAQTLVQCGSRQLNPNLDGDADCDGNAVCDGLFILDADCDPVTEDENGDFRKARLVDGKFVATASDPAAVPIWDAGENLSYATFPATHPDPAKAGRANPAYRSADEDASNKRVIYTVLDTDGDGKFTAADDRVPFEAGWASWIAPYLELNGTRTTGTQTVNECVAILRRAGACGEAPLPACPATDADGRVATADLALCAEQIILWARGWDVFDDDADRCAGPGNPANASSCPGATLGSDGVTWSGGADGEERNRPNDARPDKEFWKLGDIFHSSPVLVKPPATLMLCDLGLENQCVATIHSPSGFGSAVQTPAEFDIDSDGEIGPSDNAYEKYRRDHAARPQIVLVGANDGMLHAFDAGVVVADADADWLGTYPYTHGSGAELWAFVPPDLLPKLKLAIDDHQYFVDGNTMVRDVWHDDDRDGEKQPGEFRTMAVLSERSGGTQYLALDVTDPLDPQFRWAFPENCTLDQNVMGQTWSGFAPRPPPIGPVKLAISTGSPADPTSRGFEERWIVMVNGGYDPTLTRGRGVWMLDVWTGRPLWRFTDDEMKALHGSAAAMWSVPAAVGMVDIGDADEAILDSDGFFDTATWGDMGGQLFVARFQTPGRVGANGLVSNWYAGRTFEEQRRTDDAQLFSGRTEFFFMTANVIDLDRGYLHSYLGGGNREHLLQVGAACGPGNILGCCQAGCSADMFTHYNYDSCNVVNHVRCAAGAMTQDATSTSGSCDGTYTCGRMNANVQLHLQCGAAGNPPDIIAHLLCDADGNCTSRAAVKDGKPVRIDRLNAPSWHNRFYGIFAYGGQSRQFSDATGAQALDDNRFTDVPYAGPCAGAASCTVVDTTRATVNAAGAVTCPSGVTRCSANGDDPGWFYEYGRSCPSGACTDPLPWLDEKTASGATVLAGCVDWNTFRPRESLSNASDPCVTSTSGVARNYTYLADFVSGVPSPTCGFEYSNSATCGGTTQYVRARPRSTIAPPPDPTQLVAVGMDGEVKYLAAQIEPGGTPTTASLGTERELLQPAYWLELNREAHVCRHVEPNLCR